MGYQTKFTLTQERNHVTDTTFANLILADEEAPYSLNNDGTTRQSSKWYQSDKSICAMSAKHPLTLFKLHGDGEESGDIWDRYYVGGKMVKEIKLEPTLPVPDYDELVSHSGSVKRFWKLPITIAMEAYTAEEGKVLILAAINKFVNSSDDIHISYVPQDVTIL